MGGEKGWKTAFRKALNGRIRLFRKFKKEACSEYLERMAHLNDEIRKLQRIRRRLRGRR